MSDKTVQFPVGTVVTLAKGTHETSPASFHPGDDLTMESATGGSLSGRIVAISPERIEIASATGRYSLSPAAATLEEGGLAAYAGGWVLRSIEGA